MNKINKLTNGSRRDFLARMAAAGAVMGSGRAVAQEPPKLPADPPGSVHNDNVMAEKFSAMKPHSDRPLTASLSAEFHHFPATPNDRMFVRNNLLTPDIDGATHRLTLKGLALPFPPPMRCSSWGAR